MSLRAPPAVSLTPRGGTGRYGKDSSTGFQGEGGGDEPGPPSPPPGEDGEEEEADVSAGPPDRVFVPDCEGELGMAIVLKLIVTRQRVRLLVRDVERFEREFGPYCDCVQGSAGDPEAVAAALSGVRAVVAPGALSPQLAEALFRERREGRGPGLLVLPATSGGGGSGGQGGAWGALQRLVGGADAALSDADREKVVRNLGVPYCILNSTGVVFNARGGEGGAEGVVFSQDQGSAGSAGGIAVEDLAAACCAAAAFHTPAEGTTVWLSNSPSAGRPEQKDDWVREFAGLREDGS